MVADRVTDGRRIAELLASELDGRSDGVLDRVTVANADRDVTPTVGGALAYEVAADGAVVAGVYVHPGRSHVEVRRAVERAHAAAVEAGLTARRKASDPPRTLVFVESGAEAKRVVPVVTSVVVALSEGVEDGG